MACQWVITEDHLWSGEVVGTGTFKGNPASLPHAFRLLDDDDEVDFSGRSDVASSQAAFAPLDLAVGYAGCTSIQLQAADKWEML